MSAYRRLDDRLAVATGGDRLATGRDEDPFRGTEHKSPRIAGVGADRPAIAPTLAVRDEPAETVECEVGCGATNRDSGPADLAAAGEVEGGEVAGRRCDDDISRVRADRDLPDRGRRDPGYEQGGIPGPRRPTRVGTSRIPRRAGRARSAAGICNGRGKGTASAARGSERESAPSSRSHISMIRDQPMPEYRRSPSGLDSMSSSASSRGLSILRVSRTWRGSTSTLTSNRASTRPDPRTTASLRPSADQRELNGPPDAHGRGTWTLRPVAVWRISKTGPVLDDVRATKGANGWSLGMTSSRLKLGFKDAVSRPEGKS